MDRSLRQSADPSTGIQRAKLTEGNQRDRLISLSQRPPRRQRLGWRSASHRSRPVS
jgi:hypothetical protein